MLRSRPNPLAPRLKSPGVPPLRVAMLSVLALLAPAAALPAAQDPPRLAASRITLEGRDGSRLQGDWLELDAGSLRLQTAEGPVEWPLHALVRIEQHAVAPKPAAETPPRLAPPSPQAPGGSPELLAPARPDRIILRGGDELVGRIAAAGLDTLGFELEGGVLCEIPLDLCERILPGAAPPLDRLLRLAAGETDDRLWRRRADGGLDALTGVLDRVESEAIHFEGALGPLRFPLAEVAAVVLAPFAAAPLERAGLPVALRLAGGSRFKAGLLAVRDGQLEVSTVFAERLLLPLSALVASVRRGAGAVLLAELSRVIVEERPSIGGPDAVLFPWQRDLSVGGQPLSVGGRLAATGLSVHAHSRMVYELPAGADELRVTVGLCDEVAELPARGSVRFEILVDGESRAHSGLVQQGDAPIELRVAGLAGAARLELLVDDGGDDDAGDRAAWVNGVLLLAAEPAVQTR